MEEDDMRKLINGECGEVVRGNSDEELLAAVQVHISRDHPELVGKLSQEDVLSMAEEEE
jgi:predicted small metal-binding protein